MTDLVSTEADCGPTSTNAMGTEQAGALAGVLKALADPFRLRMLSAIASDPRGESCVCDLAELAEVSQPTVSHHLKVLKDVGVLTAQRRGTWVWYQVNPSHREGVTLLLSTLLPRHCGLAPRPVRLIGILTRRSPVWARIWHRRIRRYRARQWSGWCESLTRRC
ncbi:ArsR/SmtB family transcription factor [Ornithinimicrobium sp. INDO-MA30-4]|uniref:ArsR/SmtB family transcription factor n=1 Tax=Ornithinimicrobium sp. INDO-MA30-4 TaxID=2908651 RepID=UPI0037CC866C